MVGMYRYLEKEIDSAVKRVLKSGQYILGIESERFEKDFAIYVGAKTSVGMNSGTDALTVALWALGDSPGGEVIVPSLTATPTVAAILLANHKPVFIDVDETYTIDLAQLEEAINGKTVAIVPVHLYGHPANMPAILELAEHYGLAVIEDCAQAHGATIDNKAVGSFGEMGAFSFYPTKNLGAYGDAGIITTNSETYERRCRELRQYGWGWKSSVPRITYNHHGMNSRLDELQAAILNVKLKHVNRWNDIRRQQAQRYLEGLRFTDLILPVEREGYRHVYHQFVVRFRDREKILKQFGEAGYGLQVHYPIPVHKQPYYRQFDAFPMSNTDAFCREIFSLPIGPHITDQQVEQVIQIVKRFT